ncbi:hypothetical protein Goklo_012316, partial [Gossypium klotzschianum]|nr:hypothetical protein [Gossypium klotzschianum]
MRWFAQVYHSCVLSCATHDTRKKLSRKSDGIAQRRTRGKKGKALVRFEAGNGIGHNVLSLAAILDSLFQL